MNPSINELSPAVLADIRSGVKLAGILPEVETEIKKMMYTLCVGVYERIRLKTLTPEEAMNAWFEMAAQHRLLQRLQGKVAAATSQAEVHHKQLTGAN